MPTTVRDPMTHQRRRGSRTAVLAAVGALVLGPLSVGTAAVAASLDDWTIPACKTVDSDGSLTYSKNAGKKLTSMTGAMSPVRYQFDLITLATTDALLSADESGRLYHSVDAGCTWTTGATLPDMTIPHLVAAPDGAAYAWSINTAHLARVDGEAVTQLPDLPTEGASLVALAVDPADSAHLRAVADNGLVLDSTDGGQRFAPIGTQPSGFLYSASIDPNDLDHIVLGAQVSGVKTSLDGGATWTAVDLGQPGDRINAFTVEVSPAKGKVVYAQALNITEADSGVESRGRHIYRSWDYGMTFEVIVDQGGDIVLPNGTPLFPDAHTAGKMYWTYGMAYGGYGTDIWRYRQRGHDEPKPLRMVHNSYDDIKAIAFHPTKHRLLYLGLSDEPSGGRVAG